MSDLPASVSTKKLGLVKSQDAGFLHYLREIQKFPLLTKEEEQEYGERYAKTGDKEAAKMLVQSHLRLVAKMASKFRNYGLPMVDLVSEGNIGLMQAVKKFDPKKGFRFATYAMWWIRAYMQDYILRSWSLVKIGTTAAQKKLFFNLHKIKKKLGTTDGKALSAQNVEKISNELGVTKKEVIDMDSRLSQSDTSLNNLVGDEDDSKEVVDLMASSDISPEETAIGNQEYSRQEAAFKKAFAHLNEREQDILAKRQMSENPLTLEELSQIYKVSRERIRQIEESAINKIRKEVLKIKK
ncbi:MAG: RNA polymerase sigma factor RpoH [Rickettsiales bacterium]|nr:RNA polymerase sigma factor RpoH [Rickettsiales bacterium]